MTSSQPPVPEQPPGAPRWVKVSGVVVVVLLVVLVVAMLLGGNHGPGRHLGAPSEGDKAAVASAGVAGPVSDGW